MYPVYEWLRYLYVRPSRSGNTTSTVKSGERAGNACSRTQDSTRLFDGSFCPGACLPLPSRSKHTVVNNTNGYLKQFARTQTRVETNFASPEGHWMRILAGHHISPLPALVIYPPALPSGHHISYIIYPAPG